MKTQITHTESGAIIVEAAESPKTVKDVLRDVKLIMGKLEGIYKEMRENGDSDLRTVLMYHREAADEIDNMNY